MSVSRDDLSSFFGLPQSQIDAMLSAFEPRDGGPDGLVGQDLCGHLGPLISLLKQGTAAAFHRYFDDEFDPLLRAQILSYKVSDVITDRERAKFLGLPEDCRIRERAKIINPENFKCGRNVWIGEGALLDASGGLEIGDGTQVGLSVMVWSHTSHKQAVAGKTGSQSHEGIQRSPSRIGSNCFIAGPSVIGPGVSIGDRVIIAPLSFVHKDVPSDSVINPHRDHKRLEERVKNLEELVRDLSDRAGASAGSNNGD